MARCLHINGYLKKIMRSFSKRQVIHPGDKTDLLYWAKKWGVNVRQINDAILETGSINLIDIKNVLKKKGEIPSFSFMIHKLFTWRLNRWGVEKFLQLF